MRQRVADGQRHRPVQKRAAGDIHQLISDHHQIARALAVSNRVQSPADATARDIDRRKRVVLAQQGFGHHVGNRCGVKGLQRLQQGKAGGRCCGNLTAEIQIRIALMNRVSAFGTAKIVHVG